MAPKLFLFGGETNGKYEDSVTVLDINTKQWSQRPPMAWTKGYFGACAVDKKIYVAGGCNLHRESVSFAMEVFDESTGRWNQLQRLPENRDSSGMAALGGYIYVTGGRAWKTEEAVASVYRYGIATKQWTIMKDMPRAIYGHQLVPLNGYLYAVGGYHTKSCERYDPQTDTWTSLEDSMFEHQCPGVATHGGKIYVHGARGFEVYTPETNIWTSYKPANDYFASSLVTVGDKIWCIGGNKGNGGGPSDEVFEYDTVTQRWSSLPALQIPRQGHASFVIDC